MKKTMIWKLALVVALVAVVVGGTATWAAKPGGGGTKCPKPIFCIDLWDPVICADGITYSNSCYADRACAPLPCVPAGGGPVEI